MGASPTAPPVVAVMVTCNPGPWLEESLEAIAAQDYPNLSVLFVDSASAEDPTARVAAALPDGFIRRLDRRVGFGRAANEVLNVIHGASYYIFCHDDVAPSPDAFRMMVEEAVRSNAGLVTPKVVEWERADRLISVGLGADRVGVAHPLVERGELDQEQHDLVRDVFVAPSGVTLVRAGLFQTLGGFSTDVDEFGEDLDLSWRAQLAGARVVTAPTARVRHLEALTRGLRSGWASPLARRRAAARAETHRLRTLAVCTGIARLPFLLALAAAENLVVALAELLSGRPGDAAISVRSLGHALHHPRRLRRMRHRAQQSRKVGDLRLSRRQTRGSARLRAFVRAWVHHEPAHPLRLTDARTLDARMQLVEAEDRISASLAGPRAAPPALPTLDGDAPVPLEAVRVGRGTRRSAAGAGALILILLLIGSRGLLGGELPAIGRIPVTSGGLGEWWRSWWSTWQGGLPGGAATSPPGLGLLTLAGALFLGAVGVLQHVVVLLPLVVGPFGAYRAARWWGSMRGRVAALIAYALVPVPYNALAHGDWPGLLAYAAAPFALSMMGRLSNQPPFPPAAARAVVGRTVGFGVLVALVGAFAPSWLLAVPVLGAASSVGSLLTGQARDALRSLTVSLGAAVVAAILLLPWSAGLLHSRVAVFGVAVGPSGQLGLGQVLRMYTGPVGSEPLGWALLAAAALPLLIGRSWRLAWAGRLWMVALAVFAWVWAGSRGWLPTPAPEDLLCLAAAALAGSVALGAVAFELDLPGYRLGWRQLATGVAALAVVVAGVPTMAAAGGGRWHLPSADARSVLGFLPGPSRGDYRVLWLGSPEALPLGSRSLARGVAYATSFDGEPDEADQWPPPRSTATGIMAMDIRRSALGLTTQLGHLLAPYAVRYIVVPNHNAPSGSGAAATPVDAAVLTGLSNQTDLESVTSDPDYTVYANSAWAPIRSVTSPARTVGIRVGQAVEMAVWVVAMALITVDRRRRLGRAPERVRREWFLPLTVRRPRRSRSGSSPALAAGESPVETHIDAGELWADG